MQRAQRMLSKVSLDFRIFIKHNNNNNNEIVTHHALINLHKTKDKAREKGTHLQNQNLREVLVRKQPVGKRKQHNIYKVERKEKEKEKPSIWNSMSNKIILQTRRGNKDFVGKTKTNGICCQHKPHKRSTDGKHAIKHAQQHLSLGNYKLKTRRSDYNPIRMAQIGNH